MLFYHGSGNWMSFMGKFCWLNCPPPWHCMMSNLRLTNQFVDHIWIFFDHKVIPENVTVLTDIFLLASGILGNQNLDEINNVIIGFNNIIVVCSCDRPDIFLKTLTNMKRLLLQYTFTYMWCVYNRLIGPYYNSLHNEWEFFS